MTTTQANISQRECCACLLVKSFSEFYSKKHGKYGINSKCKDCYNNKRRSTYKVKSPEQKRTERLNAQLRFRYGITSDEYKSMKEEQNSLCPICLTNPEESGRKRTKLVVDHCHETDVVRGLLCDLCNVGLGSFQDDPERLIRAANYLRKIIGCD